MTVEEAKAFFSVGTSYVKLTPLLNRQKRESNCTYEMNRLLELLEHQKRRIDELEFQVSERAYNSRPLRQRIQRALAGVLKRLGFDIWWDVATFSPNAGHVCHNCGRHSFTERRHLTHDC